MSTNALFIIALLSTVIVASDASISCYQQHNYFGVHHKVVLHRKFCFAYFNTVDHSVALGGAGEKSQLLSRLSTALQHGGCEIQYPENNMGFKVEKTYVCVCFTNLCNDVKTYEDFTARGYTLDAKNL